MTRGYRRLLTAALARRWLVMLAFALVAGANVLLLGALKSELAPIEDRGVIIGVFVGPEGATLDYTDRYGKQLEDIYANTRRHRALLRRLRQPDRQPGDFLRRPGRLE
jgi:multidrug efflux pump